MVTYVGMSHREELEHHIIYKRSDNKLESGDDIVIAKWSVQNSWCKLILINTPRIECYTPSVQQVCKLEPTPSATT